MSTLTTIPQEIWNTTTVTNMSGCFQQCLSIDFDKMRLKNRRLRIDKIRSKICQCQCSQDQDGQ